MFNKPDLILGIKKTTTSNVTFKANGDFHDVNIVATLYASDKSSVIAEWNRDSDPYNIDLDIGTYYLIPRYRNYEVADTYCRSSNTNIATITWSGNYGDNYFLVKILESNNTVTLDFSTNVS